MHDKLQSGIETPLLFLPSFFKKKFSYLFSVVLGLCCCAHAFSSSGERGATLRCGELASHFVTSLVAEHEL